MYTEGKSYKENFLEETTASLFQRDKNSQLFQSHQEDHEPKKNKIIHLMADRMKHKSDIRTTA